MVHQLHLEWDCSVYLWFVVKRNTFECPAESRFPVARNASAVSDDMRKMIARGTAISWLIIFRNLGDSWSSLAALSDLRFWSFLAMISGSTYTSVNLYMLLLSKMDQELVFEIIMSSVFSANRPEVLVKHFCFFFRLKNYKAILVIQWSYLQSTFTSQLSYMQKRPPVILDFQFLFEVSSVLM